MQREGPRLEKRKQVEADMRLRQYFERLSRDPTYDYEGREQDLALLRRKRREGKERRG